MVHERYISFTSRTAALAFLEPGMGLDRVLLAALLCMLMQEGESLSATCSQRSRQLYCLSGETKFS